MKRCPYCGSPIVTTELILPRTKRRILAIVQHFPGISAERLRELVWINDPNGGPESRKAIHVHIHHLNKRLAPFGLAVRGSVSGGYRLQEKQ